MFVADTNMITLTDPVRSADDARRLDLAGADIYLTTVTAAEIHAGIFRLDRAGAARQAAVLLGWWEGVERFYGDRILPFDLDAAKVAGRLSDRAAADGHDIAWADIQVAAIASARGFTVLTRSGRRFEPLGVAFVDPFYGPANR